MILSFLATVLLSQKVFAYVDIHGPRDRFWRHHARDKTLLIDGVDHYQNIENCLDSKLTEQDKKDIETDKADRKIGLTLEDPDSQQVILVAIESAITPTHTKALQSLAACVREFIPKTYEVRPMFIEFGLDHDIGLGGNTPTHLAPLVGIFLPAVAEEMQRTLEFAYDTARWSEYSVDNGTDPEEALPYPKDVGFRACEHLSYKDFTEGLNDHHDGSDTYYTFNYAFSGPGDYSGGYYYLNYGQGNPKPQKIFLKPNKYDALIFLGGRYEHGVTPITSGEREMFSSELWALPDAPFGSNLWNNYEHVMEEYIQRCDMEIAQGHQGPCTVDMWSIKRRDFALEEDDDDDDEDNDDDEDDDDDDEQDD